MGYNPNFSSAKWKLAHIKQQLIVRVDHRMYGDRPEPTFSVCTMMNVNRSWKELLIICMVAWTSINHGERWLVMEWTYVDRSSTELWTGDQLHQRWNGGDYVAATKRWWPTMATKSHVPPESNVKTQHRAEMSALYCVFTLDSGYWSGGLL